MLTHAIDVAHIGKFTGSLSGPLVVVHHLSSGCCHTSCGSMSVVSTIGWALVVVGGVLVPFAGEQWSDEHVRLRAWSHIGTIGMRAQVLHLLGVAVEPVAHAVGDVVGVKRTTITIAQHRSGLVVARDDNESIVFAVVEHIVIHLLVSTHASHRQRQLRGLCAYTHQVVLCFGSQVVTSYILGFAC